MPINNSRSASKGTPAQSGGYASSPSGKHRRLAKYYFALARRARRAGNRRAAATALKLGRAALNLSRQEWLMWKRGQRLSRAAFGLRTNFDTAPFMPEGSRRGVESPPYFRQRTDTGRRYKIPLTIVPSKRRKGSVELVDRSHKRP